MKFNSASNDAKKTKNAIPVPAFWYRYQPDVLISDKMIAEEASADSLNLMSSREDKNTSFDLHNQDNDVIIDDASYPFS